MRMTRLIDAEKLKDAIEHYCRDKTAETEEFWERHGIFSACADIDEIINDQPTVTEEADHDDTN